MKTTVTSNTDPKSKKAYAKPVSTSIAIMHPAILEGSEVIVDPSKPGGEVNNKDDTAGYEQNDLW